MTKVYPSVDYKTLALVASKTTNGVMITDANGLLEWCNEGFSQMTGFSLEEVVGRKPGSFLQGAHSSPDVLARMSASLRQGAGFEEEIVNYRKDGQPFWGLLSVSPIKNSLGEPERWIGLMLDITHKKNQEEEMTSMQEELLSMAEAVNTKMEYALKNAEANLYALIENTTESIWSIDREYRLLTANAVFRQRFHQLYGVWLQLGTPLLEQLARVYEEAKLAEHRIWYERAFAGEIFSVTETVVIQGTAYYFDLSFYPIRAIDNHVQGISVFSKDITHQKKIENELRERERALTEINKELDTLIYRSSHDFMGPVASIKGLLNLLRMEDGTPPSAYIEKIESCNLKLESIIHNLFRATYINQEPLKTELVDFDEIVSAIIRQLQEAHTEYPIEFRYHNYTETRFYSDAFRITTILTNVLDNAVRFCNPKTDSFVEVTITPVGGNVCIQISDNGIGIEEHLVRGVFDMFNRAHVQSKGTGLGLYVVKKAVEKLAGTIRLSSRPFQGVQIQIVLPNQAFR